VISEVGRERICKKLCWCLEANPRIVHVVPKFVEGQAMKEKLSNNMQNLLEQFRVLFSMICGAKAVPLDLVRVFLEISSFLRVK
jgi:hypothetical protein